MKQLHAFFNQHRFEYGTKLILRLAEAKSSGCGHLDVSPNWGYEFYRDLRFGLQNYVRDISVIISEKTGVPQKKLQSQLQKTADNVFCYDGIPPDFDDEDEDLTNQLVAELITLEHDLQRFLLEQRLAQTVKDMVANHVIEKVFQDA